MFPPSQEELSNMTEYRTISLFYGFIIKGKLELEKIKNKGKIKENDYLSRCLSPALDLCDIASDYLKDRSTALGKDIYFCSAFEKMYTNETARKRVLKLMNKYRKPFDKIFNNEEPEISKLEESIKFFEGIIKRRGTYLTDGLPLFGC